MSRRIINVVLCGFFVFAGLASFGHKAPLIAQAVETTLGSKTTAQAPTVTRFVTVNRGLSAQQVLDATKRKQSFWGISFVNEPTVATIPSNGTGVQRVEVIFFELGRNVSDDELAKEYKERGLTPDFYAQAQVNIDDPAFGDEYPNASHWKDSQGKWLCAFFYSLSDGERHVDVRRSNYDWDGNWSFAGVRSK